MIIKKIAAAVIVTVATLSMVCSASACTALYVGSDLTEDGTTMFGRIEDLGTNDYNKLYYVSAAGKHKVGEVYNGCHGVPLRHEGCSGRGPLCGQRHRRSRDHHGPAQ